MSKLSKALKKGAKAVKGAVGGPINIRSGVRLLTTGSANKALTHRNVFNHLSGGLTGKLFGGGGGGGGEAPADTGGETNVEGLNYDKIYDDARRQAGLTVERGDLLKNALNTRAKDMYQSLAEEFNARGQDPRSALFVDSMNKNLANIGTEAELAQANKYADWAAGASGNMMTGDAGTQNLQFQATEAQKQRALDAQLAAQARADAKKQKKAGQYGAIGGALLGLAIPGLGPAGALMGAQYGSQVGDYFG